MTIEQLRATKVADEYAKKGTRELSGGGLKNVKKKQATNIEDTNMRYGGNIAGGMERQKRARTSGSGAIRTQ